MHTCARRVRRIAKDIVRPRASQRRRMQSQAWDESSRTADARPDWDRNRSSGFSDRPNQCKQLDIAGNISFLRAARRSTAKRGPDDGLWASKAVGILREAPKEGKIVG